MKPSVWIAGVVIALFALLGSVLYSLWGLVIDVALERMMGRSPQ
mgnify:CR=1 FL=1